MQNLQKSLYDLSASNPFIQVNISKLWHIEDGTGTNLETLYKKASFYKKEYDLRTTLKISAFIKWKEPGREIFFISPLIYKPCSIQLRRKIEQEYSLQTEEEEPYEINPILIHSFSRYFDVTIPNKTDNTLQLLTDFVKSFESQANQIKILSDFNEDEEWQIITKNCVGNFNYKKSLLGQDYESILLSPNQQIECLLSPILKETAVASDNSKLILTADFSQTEAIRKSELSNLVIQGPPGTGKSHTIVGLIGNYLSQGKKVLFVSQKRSALEVVYDRLCSLGLAELIAFLDSEKDEKKAYYSGLKKSWEKLSKPLLTKADSNYTDSNELLNFYLSKYIEVNDKLGMTVHDAVKHLANSEFNAKELVYSSSMPALKDWNAQIEQLQHLELQCQNKFNKKTLADNFFIQLNRAVFSEPEPTIKLDKRINDLLETLNSINEVQENFGIDKGLKEITELAIAASILNMVNLSQLDLLNIESKKYSSFGKISQKYEQIKSRLERSQIASSKWVNKPNKNEITELLDLLKHQHAPRGIFGILKRRSDTVKNAFQGFDTNISDRTKIQLLEELREEWNLKAEFEEICLKLSHQYQILDPENEVSHILRLRNKLNSISQNDYLFLLENEKSVSLIQALSQLHQKLQNFNNLVRFIFENPLPENLQLAKKQITELSSQIHQLRLIEPELNWYFQLSSAIRNFISQNNFSIKKLTSTLIYNQLIEQTRFDKQFDNLSGKALESALKSELKRLEQEQKLVRSSILENQQKLVIQNEKLIGTAASKLTAEQKVEKQRFKGMKKSIIHEISKKQRHQPIKQFAAENWDYISTVQPLWIMNPLAVSERLNCEANLFDVVIFDESSQIPLEDGIPAIHRAKQVIVVGDDQQMPPSNFFSSNTEGITLLDQADLAYEHVMLKWHYRSEHPALIAFSNQYFYENELLTPPPITQDLPIVRHKTQGIFENGSNKIEAQSIAQFLVKSGYKFSDVGVIAFSKEQEKAIEAEVNKLGVQSEDLLIRNLENVQGVEKPYIIISTGYAKNPEGVFRQNFGPVSHTNGANRLNVLFTRAQKRIDVFTSVDSEDFKISDNIGASYLKDYLKYVEDIGNSFHPIQTNNNFFGCDDISFYNELSGSAISCYIQHGTSKVLLIDPCTGSNESQDLITIYSILSTRFKKVKILLSNDERKDKENFAAQISTFFKRT